MRRLLLSLTIAVFPGLIFCSDDNADPEKEADSGPPQRVEHYVPADNAAGDWVEDAGEGTPGVEAGYTTKEIEDIINGAHDAYRDEGSEGFARQDYQIGEMTLKLYLWDMETADGALKMFNANKTKGEEEEGLTFEVVAAVPDQAIIANDALIYKAYLVKHDYIAKITSRCKSSSDKEALRAATLEFVSYLASQLP